MNRARRRRRRVTSAKPYKCSSCGAEVPDSPDPISDEQLARAGEALEKVGVSIGALHARWARLLVEDIGRLAREGLASAEGRKVVH